MTDRTQFEDRLAELVQAKRSQIVVGLDPDPASLWPAGSGPAGAAVTASFADPTTPAVRAAAAVANHCAAVIEAVADEVVAVKLQVACFERLGAPGWRALEETAAAARAAGLLVIADAKRGDIDVSAHAYAQAFLGATLSSYGEIGGLGADALTVNPYMGADTVAVFAAAARERHAQIFLLVRTSNPGAADIEDLDSGGAPVWEHAARLVTQLGLGAVVGATQPEHVGRMRELMPSAVFLLPGVGAQGGTVAQLAPAFGPAPHLGLVTASRSIVGTGSGSDDPAVAARLSAAQLRESAWALGRPAAD
ncbi:MAG TPA: orotidine-5'-phosphate decarboxylase [Baekduia sp.]|nr:orotidine-5'-phosphate decarboxylase [Baekduia sp.]